MHLLAFRTRHLFRVAVPTALLLLAVPTVAADPSPQAAADAVDVPATLAPEAHHAYISGAVAQTLAHYHYDGHAITDEVAAQWMASMIDDLDGRHQYFMASDVAEFKALAATMDDDIRARSPTLTAAFTVYERYRERAAQALDASDAELATDLSFDDADAVWTRSEEPGPWPSDQATWEARWRKGARAQVLDLMLIGKDKEAAKETVQKRNNRARRYLRDLDSSDVVETYLTALAGSFDPHSAYFKPSTNEDFTIRMADSLEGIGAKLTQPEEYTVIKRLIAGGPAKESGQLKAGDLIVAVAQGGEEAVDVVDMRLDNVVQLIRGKKGTEVRLTIQSGTDSTETKIVSIVRDKVILERASAKAEIKEVKQGDEAYKVGVINVPSFYVDWGARRAGDPNFRSTTRDTSRLISELREQGMQTLVVDLRGNGGGSLMEAVSMTGLFIDAGPVVQIHDPSSGVDVLRDKDRGVAWSGPLVVVTDELSASASEIFAGAVQDYGRGLIVGAEATHGKGTVQSIVDMGEVLNDPAFAPQAGALKLTVQKFYRVTGASTQHRGVRPDVALPSPWAGLDVKESDLEHALPWDEISAARYRRRELGVELPSLQLASAERVAAGQSFQWLAEDIAEREMLRKRGSVSLHWDSRKTETEQRKAKLKARRTAAGLLVGEAREQAVEGGADDVTLDTVLDNAILDEAVTVAAAFAESWRADAALLNADASLKTPARDGSDKAAGRAE